MKKAAAAPNLPGSHDVFISYSRKDQDFVRRLDDELKKRGREAWVDWEGIRPTEEFMRAIYGAIESADTFVFVLTPDSLASQVCAREIAYAAAHNKRMVPLVAREVDTAFVPETLAKLNWIFARDSDSLPVAADSLISALDTDLGWIHAHTRLLTRALEWETNKRSNSFALRGEDLRAAEQWLAQAGAEKERQPTALQTEYIIASRKASARRLRITLAGVCVALLVALGLAVIAMFARQEATRQRQVAIEKRDEAAQQRDVAVEQQKISRSRELAAASLGQLAADPELSVLLGVEAVRVAWTGEAESALREALVKSHVRAILPGHEYGARSIVFAEKSTRFLTLTDGGKVRVWSLGNDKPLTEFRATGSSRAALLSPDEQTILTVGYDGAAELWDSTSGKKAGEISGESGKVADAIFVEETIVFATCEGPLVRVWRRDDRKLISELRGHTGEILRVMLAPGGRFATTESADNTGRLWEIEGGKSLASWQAPARMGWTGAFSQNGARLIHGTADFGAAVLESATGRILSELRGHTGGIKAYIFDSTGKRVLTGGFDWTGKIWDPEKGTLLSELRGHEHILNRAAFSPNGQLVATASSDDTARLWQVESGKALAEFRGHRGEVIAVAFSPDGNLPATGSHDGSARLWEVPRSIVLRGHPDVVWASAFSPDGKLLVTAGRDKVPRVWEAASGNQLFELHGHTDVVWAASFSPNGKTILTASADGTARIWDASTGQSLHELRGPGGQVVEARFSPVDDEIIATAGRGGSACLWRKEKLLVELRGNTGEMLDLTFSRDGRLLATAGRDGTALIYEVPSGQVTRQLHGHTAGLNAVAFNSDASRLLTMSEDKTARVWNVSTGETAVVLTGQDEAVLGGEFSPDDKLIVTRGDASEPIIWNPADGKVVARLRGHSGEITSACFSPDSRLS